MPALGNALGLPFGRSAASWTPAQLATPPSFWLPTSSLTGLADNDPCSSYLDISGNGRHFNATGTERFTYKTNILNGYPVLRADGVDDVHRCVSSTSIRSLALVARYNAALFATDYPGLITGGAAADAFVVGLPANNTGFFAFPADAVFYKNNVETDETASGSAPMNAFAVLFLTFNARNYTWQLGNDRGFPTRFWLGDYAEVIGSSVVWDSTERGLLYNYLKTKYAL
jgi:hypothetical protein